MIDENALKHTLDDFQRAVRKLGDTVNKSGVEWNDAQFRSMAASVKNVAASSKQVIVIGNQCCSAIKRFNAIESER